MKPTTFWPRRDSEGRHIMKSDEFTVFPSSEKQEEVDSALYNAFNASLHQDRKMKYSNQKAIQDE